MIKTEYLTSDITCGVMCFKIYKCKGFDYQMSTSKCILYSEIIYLTDIPPTMKSSDTEADLLRYGKAQIYSTVFQKYYMFGMNQLDDLATANATCQQWGMNLVALKSSEEMRFVHSEYLKFRDANQHGNYNDFIWTSASDFTGSFLWEDGDPLDHSQWAPSEPNGQHCVLYGLYHNIAGGLMDDTCVDPWAGPSNAACEQQM